MKMKKAVCPVEDTINVIGKKWVTLIIRDLLSGKKRFFQLERSLKHISPRTLSARLVDMESEGLLTKKIFHEVPPHTEYELTRQGKALAGILDQMVIWNKKYR